MGLMPVRCCPNCGANRHVTAFLPESDWCKSCRDAAANGKVAASKALSPTEILTELIRQQRLTNPALADKQEHLIQLLRSEHDSDEKVLAALKGLFALGK